MEERINVPSGSVIDRYTWPEGSVLEPGEVSTVCSTQAVGFLQQQCNATASLGVNGNDALLLYNANGDVMVRLSDYRANTDLMIPCTWGHFPYLR